MISADLRTAWTEAAYVYCFKKNGIDFTPEVSDMRAYLRSRFNRKATKYINDNNLGQNIDVVMEALSSDSEKDRYIYRQEAAVLLDTLEAHINPDLAFYIPQMRLNVSDGAAP